MSDSFYESYAVYTQVAASILFFIAMVVIWNRYVAPAVVAAAEKKNLELADAERRRDEAKAAAETAHEEVATAQRDAAEIAVRAERDAATLTDRIVSDAEAENRRVQRTAEGELERSRAAARDALRTEIVNRAVAIARDGATRLDEASNRRMVTSVLDAEAAS